MRELTLSIFADESGGQNGTSKYYLLTLVLHDQSSQIGSLIEAYRNSLASKELPDIPLHASPLIYGKGDYDHLDLAARKRLLASFFVLTRRLPVRYKTLAYKRAEVSSLEQLIARIRRDLVVFISDNLDYFQSFDTIKIYYDNGQHAVTEALHAAIEFMLSKNAVAYKDAHPQDYVLSQVADFLCTIELTAIKYENHDETNTDLKVFGNVTEFKKGVTPGIYTSKSVLFSYDWEAVARTYPLWVAQYPNYEDMGFTSDPWTDGWDFGAWDSPLIFQYTGTGRIPGYGGHLDLDLFYGTHDDWRRLCAVAGASAGTKEEDVVSISRANVAAQIMEHLCSCPLHGYSQPGRHGTSGHCDVGTDAGTIKVTKGDRDCSSAVCEAWELALAGSPYDGLITRYNWTGGMREMFVGSGLFSWEPMSFNASRGDIYLNEENHTAMCIRNDGTADLLGEFSISETGGIDGEPGDQTGRESWVHDYYSGSWDGILHYNGKADVGGAPDGSGSGAPSGDVSELAARVIAGDFGNGDARRAALGSRYDEVQAEVNRILPGGTSGGSCDVDALARRVIAGEFGNGDERKRHLGSKYSAVQNRVNEILGATGASSTSMDVDAMARAAIRGDYGNGDERKRRLGSYYSIVQRRVNEMLS